METTPEQIPLVTNVTVALTANGGITLVAKEPNGDPVELSAPEARWIARSLLATADSYEKEDLVSHELSVGLWLDPAGGITLKSPRENGTPVEMAPHQARRLGQRLLAIADEYEHDAARPIAGTALDPDAKDALLLEDALAVMFEFLQIYWKEAPTALIADVLSEVAPAYGGHTSDPAVWGDWQRAATAVRRRR